MLPFDDPVYMAWLGFNPQADSEELRFGYTSDHTIFNLSMEYANAPKQLLKQQEVKALNAICMKVNVLG